MSEPESTVPVSEPSESRRLFIGLGVLAVIIFAIVVAVVVLIFLDPFGWDLLGASGKDSAVEAIPADALMYMHFNLDSLDDKNLETIIRALSPEPIEEDVTFIDQQIERLDEMLTEELNMTYADDIRPWIGNDIGFGVSNLMSGLSSGSGEEVFLVVVEVDNGEAADEFVAQVIAELETRNDTTAQEEVYEDETIYFIEYSMMDTMAICRSGDHLLISIDVGSIQNGIDAQKGESLADLEIYQDGIKALPGDRMLTIYLDMVQYQEDLSPIISMAYGPGMTDLISESNSPASAGMLGISAIDVGIKIDSVEITYSEEREELPEMCFNPEPQTASLAPEDTILYLTSEIATGNLDLMKEGILELIDSQGADGEEALAMFALTFGFDPIEDLIGNLEGEIAVLLLPASEGVLAESMDVPLGFAILAETKDSDALLEVAEKIGTAVETLDIGTTEVSEQSFGTIYDLFDAYSGELVATYGVGEDHLMIGSSTGVLDDVFNGGPSLADSDGYQEVWDAFPRGMAPVMYMDIEGLIGQIRESMEPWERENFDEEVGQVLTSMRFLAAAISPMEDNIAFGTFILFIDME